MKKAVKIHVLHCGYIRIKKDLLDNEGRFSSDIARAMITPDSHRVTLPVSAFLIEHPAGLYLVDTGWSRDPDLPRHLTALYHPDVPDGMTVVEQMDVACTSHWHALVAAGPPDVESKGNVQFVFVFAVAAAHQIGVHVVVCTFGIVESTP